MIYSYHGTETICNDLHALQSGDTVIIERLDLVAKSLTHGYELINWLIGKGIKVHILNIGIISNEFMQDVFSKFVEFEHNKMTERAHIAKNSPHNGRPIKYTKEQLDTAINLLEEHSFENVNKITGISTKKLLEERKKRYGTKQSEF